MPTAPKSLTCSLDWRDVLTAIGLDCLPLAVLPQSAECPLCGYGIITAMEDPVLDSVWFHCPECRFAGDIIQLAGAHLDCSEREAIVSLSALRVMPEELSDKDVEDYLTFHLQPRRRINDFWEAARLRPMIDISRKGAQLLRKYAITENVLRELWEGRESTVFGTAQKQEVEELFAPHAYAHQERQNPNGTTSVRRGSGPGSHRIFKGHGWDEILAIAHYDLPGRIVGFTLVGRNADPEEGDVIFKRVNLGAGRRPKESGIGMLRAVRGGSHRMFGRTVFAFTDPKIASILHARNFRASGAPLPLVLLALSNDHQSLHLPPELKDRKIIFCGPPLAMLPVARRHDAYISDYEISASELEANMRRREPFDFLRQFKKHAAHWFFALEKKLPSMSCGEAQIVMARLELTPTECRQLGCSLRGNGAEDFARLEPFRLGARRVRIGKATVVESADGWHVEGTGERICNYPIRIMFVATMDDGASQYLVSVRRPERPVDFIVAGSDIRQGNLLAPVREALKLRDGDILSYHADKWSKHSLFIAMELSQPETMRRTNRVGWFREEHQFQFSNFALLNSGRAVLEPIPMVREDGPQPAIDLPLPRVNYRAIELLSARSRETQTVWALAACCVHHMMCFYGHPEQPFGIVLDGRYARDTGASAARALGCGVTNPDNRGRRSCREHIGRDCDIHSLPTVVDVSSRTRMLSRRVLTLSAIEGQFKAVKDNSLTQVLNGLNSTTERVSNSGISPCRPIGVRLQKDLCPAHLLRRSLELLDDFLARLTFFIREPNDISFKHLKPPCSRKFQRIKRITKPQFLDWTTH